MNELLAIAPQLGVALVIIGSVFYGIERMKKVFENSGLKADIAALKEGLDDLKEIVTEHIREHKKGE